MVEHTLLSNPIELLGQIRDSHRRSSKLQHYSNGLQHIFNKRICDRHIMAEEVMDQLAPNVRSILHILHMPDVEDGDLPELIFRLGQTSKSV